MTGRTADIWITTLDRDGEHEKHLVEVNGLGWQAYIREWFDAGFVIITSGAGFVVIPIARVIEMGVVIR